MKHRESFQVGRNGQGNLAGTIQVGAGPQFEGKPRMLDLVDPDRYRRVLLPMPSVALTSGDIGSSEAQPQDIFQVEWLHIPAALRIIAGSAVATSSFPAVQVDDSGDFTITNISVGTAPQVLATGEMPISAFANWSQIPDLIFDGGPTAKKFIVAFKNNGTQEHTLRPVAVALKAM